MNTSRPLSSGNLVCDDDDNLIANCVSSKQLALIIGKHQQDLPQPQSSSPLTVDDNSLLTDLVDTDRVNRLRKLKNVASFRILCQ